RHRNGRIEYCLDKCRIREVQRRLLGTLSKGYRQRVGLADTMLAAPPVLILDEPTSGLDPIQIAQTLEMIKDLGGRHTVLLSTHILSEVEKVCERVIIINKGRVNFDDTLTSIARREPVLQYGDRVAFYPRRGALRVVQPLDSGRRGLELLYLPRPHRRDEPNSPGALPDVGVVHQLSPLPARTVAAWGRGQQYDVASRTAGQEHNAAVAPLASAMLGRVPTDQTQGQVCHRANDLETTGSPRYLRGKDLTATHAPEFVRKDVVAPGRAKHLTGTVGRYDCVFRLRCVGRVTVARPRLSAAIHDQVTGGLSGACLGTGWVADPRDCGRRRVTIAGDRRPEEVHYGS
ncbi:MAG TPA: ATP-binding cassette domain-containing protein, partial [Urbifossiella sp.]|nr:ATP-binding cassette domain-containing protein [Urbifossiella sp.]